MCNLAHEINKKDSSTMEKRNFVNIDHLSKEKILYMIQMAQEFEKHPNREILGESGCHTIL